MLEQVQTVSLPGLPDWVTSEVIIETRALFERLYGQPLSSDDLTEILVNTDQMFRVLNGGAALKQPISDEAATSDCRARREKSLDKSSGPSPPASVEGSRS